MEYLLAAVLVAVCVTVVRSIFTGEEYGRRVAAEILPRRRAPRPGWRRP